MSDQIHVGDIGTGFIVTIENDGASVDISGATTKQLIFLPPDNTEVVQIADFFTDGTDGILQYVTVEGDLNQSGSWRLQGFVVLPDGEWHTDVYVFKVYTNI